MIRVGVAILSRMIYNGRKLQVIQTKSMQCLSTSMAIAVLLFIALAILGCIATNTSDSADSESTHITLVSNEQSSPGFTLDNVPKYMGKAFVEANGNIPYFSDDDLSCDSFETYSALDSLGRCGPAYALIGPETMPSAKRSNIGMVKPSGWQISKYDWIDGQYLFNRCHLIAYSLAGENDNPLNLITGTRSMNVLGMLPHEEQIASYVHETGNHVLYRVSPLYDGDNLVASGVLMEAESVEDRGEGISFCVWCYNVEPGVVVDYATGDNRTGNPEKESYHEPISAIAPDASDVTNGAVGIEGGTEEDFNAAGLDSEVKTYVLNTHTYRFHYPGCPSAADIKEKNKQVFGGTRKEVLEKGYEPCGACMP